MIPVKGATRFLKASLFQLQRLLDQGDGVIFQLHSVADKNFLDTRLVSNPAMELAVNDLETGLKELQDQDVMFISMDQLHEMLGKPEASKDQRFALLTLDDGYRDNYSNVFPLCKRLDIPFTLYLITGFPDGTQLHYAALLQDWVQENEALEFTHKGKVHHFQTRSRQEKQESYQAICTLLASSFIGADYPKFFEENGIEPRRYTLNWEEVEEMAGSELVTLGSHTMSHRPLTTLNEVELERELCGSKQRIEEMSGAVVHHLSYPFGKYGTREICAARKAGYLTATTTKQGFVKLGKARDMALSRVLFSPGRKA